jgi:hypothetical protein
MVLDDVSDPRVFEELKAAIREACRLVRVDCNVMNGCICSRKQPVADIERRDANPRPTSMVYVAPSRMTQLRSDSPSSALIATGKRSCDVPSDRAMAVPSLTSRSMTA